MKFQRILSQTLHSVYQFIAINNIGKTQFYGYNFTQIKRMKKFKLIKRR